MKMMTKLRIPWVIIPVRNLKIEPMRVPNLTVADRKLFSTVQLRVQLRSGWVFDWVTVGLQAYKYGISVRERLAQHLGAQKPDAIPKSEKSDKPRRMQDSYDRVLLPLRTDEKLREAYLNPYYYLRFGMVLEDLDTFAGMVI